MSLRDELQAALGSAFAVERELAGGGMSRVFVASEIALDRRVVVKVLHPELAGDVTAERFAREIQVVARLQQANIVPLHSSGRVGTLPYYTMPFVEGLSLRQRLAGQAGGLPIPETLGVLRDVARALAFAHEAGVMHRDIKPENVLLSGGAAVVTDFGIAKAISAARTQPGAATITQAGASVGTPAYMAPEQAAGDPTTDYRADIYAFGCLAYELLTGRPPFRDGAAHELIAAHMTRTPVDVVTLRPDAPPGVSRLVMRCLEKSPDLRPQSMREVLGALDAVGTPEAPARPGRTGARRRIVAAVLVATVLAGGAYLVGHAPGAAVPAAAPAIAVIPFVNVGGDTAQDYLADGLSDEIATSVGRIPGIRLAARSGAYRYRGRRDVDVRDVGRALQVAYVVQGTVRESGDQLRVSAQLTDARTGVEVWSQPFDGTRKDVFKTQDRIAAAISAALALKVGGSAGRAAPTSAAIGTSDIDAYDAYLRGEFYLRRRQVVEAERMFSDAINRDPNFARAYAGRSAALALGPYYASIAADRVLPRVLDASDHALALDSTLAEAYTAQGIAYMNTYRWRDARDAFARAIRVDPSNAEAHFHFGRWYLTINDPRRALVEWQAALAIDPFSALASAWAAVALLQLGRADEALAAARRGVQYDSTAAAIKFNAAIVYLNSGDTASALTLADHLPAYPPWPAWRAMLHGLAGDSATPRAIMRQFANRSPMPWFGHTVVAGAALAVGDTATALTALERATDAKENWATFLIVGVGVFRPVLSSPRWAAVARRVGLRPDGGLIE